MLELKKLNKFYYNEGGDVHHALKDVDLKLDDTGMVFVTGPSGGGKSTLLNIIGGLDGFENGTMLIKGVDSKQLNEKAFDSYRNTYVGFIFQEFNLLDYLTLAENVALAVELQDKKPTREEISEVFKKLNIGGLEDRYPNQISGGQRQRVAIARVLIKKPKILFADEASGSVDVATGRAIYQILKKLSKEILVISVTHSLELAEKYADRIIRIEDGRIVSDEMSNASGEEKSAYNDEMIYIEPGKALSVADIDEINRVITGKGKKGAFISVSGNAATVEKAFPKAAAAFKKDQEKAKKESAKKTQQPEVKKDTEPFKLVKAKLPAKVTYKLSKTNFTSNKFRTTFTIVLTILAICFFAVSNILTNFDSSKANIKVFKSSNMPYINLYSEDNMLLPSDINLLQQKAKVASKDSNFNSFGLVSMIGSGNGVLEGAYVAGTIGKEDVLLNKTINYIHEGTNGVGAANKFNQTILLGNWPTNANEITISDYAAYQLKANKFTTASSLDDLLGSEITLSLADGVYSTKTLKIVGIYNTNINSYYNVDETSLTLEQKTLSGATLDELKYVKNNVFNVMYVNDKDSQFSTYFIPQTALTNRYFAGVSLTGLDGSPVAYTISPDINVPNGELRYNGTTSAAALERLTVSLGKGDDRIVLFENQELFNVKKDGGAYKDESGQDQTYNFGIPANTIHLSQSDYNALSKVLVMPNSNIAIGRDFTTKQLNLMADAIANTQMVTFDSQNIKDFANKFVVVGSGFLTASIALALFAVVLLYNFVAQSVRSKRKNIGILRAIGAGMKDIIKIFMLEAAILAGVIAFGSIIFTGLTTLILNAVVQGSVAYGLTVFTFSFATMAIMFGISVVVTFVSYLVPMYPLSKIKPIEIIQKKTSL